MRYDLEGIEKIAVIGAGLRAMGLPSVLQLKVIR